MPAAQITRPSSSVACAQRTVPQGLRSCLPVGRAHGHHHLVAYLAPTTFCVRDVTAKVAYTTTVSQQGASRVEPSASAAPNQGVFNWTGRWWPVHATDSLDRKIPMHVDLLGQSLVVWGDGQGTWHCLEDKCPHRLAPLSEGRVENGDIMCCYHGWTFSGAGACTSIPQLKGDSKAHANACSSRRACVTAYPTRVAHGLLWVWPESGPAAEQAAAATEPADMSNSDCTPWYVRDVPIRYDTLLENVSDPSHVQYAHHGIQGDRYTKRPNPWMGLKVEASGPEGYVTTVELPKPFTGKADIVFEAPFHAIIRVDGKHAGPQVAVVPTRPGWSRLYANFPMEFKRLPWPIRKVMRLKNSLTALDHTTNRNPVIDGDTYMLHIAERLLTPSKGLGLRTASHEYFMPAAADNPVTEFRRWLGEHAGPVPTCTPADEAAMPKTMLKEQVLDRWNQHTKHCSHCLKALATLDKVRALSVAVGLAATVAAVAQAVAATAVTRMAGPAVAPAAASLSALPSWLASTPAAVALASWWQACQAAGLQQSMVVCGALGVLGLGLWKVLNNFRGKFYYEEYIHALRD